MRTAGGVRIYEELGVRPVINAMGSVTLLGGSTLAPEALAAMREANEAFVEMEELLDRSGRAVARLLGAEAALVTSGAFAALVLGAAAIMTGGDPERIGRLPDADGMRRDFLIPAPARYNYDRAVSVPGGRLLEVGDARGATAAQLEAAIGPETAGVLYPARSEGAAGVPPLAAVVEVARRRDVAVLVDAAAEIYPLERMLRLAGGSGADLTCFGAKYFGSANSAGILCGRRALVEAAARNNFIAFETEHNRAMGRGFKVDRQEVVATVVALRAWLDADHAARFAEQERRLATIAGALAGLPRVTAERVRPREGAWIMLRVTLDGAPSGTLTEVDRALRAGDSPIRVRLEEDHILVAVHPLREGEDAVVAARLREVLSG